MGIPKIALFLVLFGAAMATTGFADEIDLNSSTELYDPGAALLLYEDQSGTLSIQEIQSIDNRFERSGSAAPNFGFTSTIVWAKFAIRNGTNSTSWILEHDYAPMDYIDFYLLRDGTLEKSAKSGDLVAQSERDRKGRISQFYLDLEAGATYTVYLRFQTESSLVIPLKLRSLESAIQRDSQRQLIIGLYFGLMIIMVLYNLVIFLSTREKSYLYYVLFVAAHALFQACLLGVAQVYLWPNGTNWTNTSLGLFASLALAFSALFTREFLRTRKLLPKFGIVIDICLALALVNSFTMPLLSYAVGIRITNASLVVYSFIFIAAGIIVLRRGYKPARFYLLGWSLLAISAVIVALKNYGFLASTPFTNHVLQIGSIFEVLLLSLAITDRINLLRQEKLATEEQLLESQRAALIATEEKLYHDNLTGLPNRNRLISDIGGLGGAHLYLVNVDKFKQVNDYYGNKVGDQVLLELRRRIESLVPDTTTKLYKLHADEYALVIGGGDTGSRLSEARCIEIGNDLHEVCQNEPYAVNDRFVRLDVSVGIAGGVDSLLEQADMALSEARRTHTSVKLYDDSMPTKQQYENNLKVVSILRDALSSDAIVPYCQPIIRNSDRRIEKYECLMRIRDGSGDIVSPGAFIEIAKASKLYPELSRRMIGKSFELLKDSKYDFTLNLSIDDILSEETIDVIRGCLDDCRSSASVIFEILESEGIDRYDLVSEFIDEMKSRGCGIAIDDFGSGYSNFEHILRLNVDYIKLNSTLIRNLDTDPQAKAIVLPIVDFSKSLDILTVAEFVHSEPVFQEVDSLGIDYSQGNHFGAAAAQPIADSPTDSATGS